MKNYAELLESEDWQNRRNEILLRDSLQCRNCLNFNLVKDCRYGLVVKSFPYSNYQLSLKYNFFVFDHDGSRISLLNCKVKNQELISDTMIGYYSSIEQGQQNLIALRLFDYPVENDNLLSSAISLLKQKIGFGIPKKYYFDPFDLPNYQWIHVNGLHVHHNYYQKNLYPWEYPDEALVTLCWVCHEKFHKEQKVDVYDEWGEKIDHFTNCFRCYGAGYFPKYAHVEEGICFRCRGARYEELIQQE